MSKYAPSAELCGEILVGNLTEKSWFVKDLLTDPDQTNNRKFSFGYIVQDESKREYFLKATDPSLIVRDTQTNKLHEITDELWHQRHVRDMLSLCKSKGLSRIVQTIDFGEHSVIQNGIREIVFFIVFEKAVSDIRPVASNLPKMGYRWVPRIVNNLTLAVFQLHSNDIVHNNIKPSNFLFFDMLKQKLGDLGRATSVNLTGPNDKLTKIGDSNYLAPEEWGYDYNVAIAGDSISQNYRKLCDVYMLGGLIYFLFTGVSINSTIMSNLIHHLRPTHNLYKFAEILPFIESAHLTTITSFKEEISTNFGSRALIDLKTIIDYVNFLTNPNPEKRGDPVNKKRGLQQFDLQRLVSHSDRLTKILEGKS